MLAPVRPRCPRGASVCAVRCGRPACVRVSAVSCALALAPALRSYHVLATGACLEKEYAVFGVNGFRFISLSSPQLRGWGRSRWAVSRALATMLSTLRHRGGKRKEGESGAVAE